MEKLNILIADPSEDFRTALSEALMGQYRVRLCRDGPGVRDALGSFRPDILILDLMLPGIDGISILQGLAAAGLTPTVLATTRYVSDYILDSLENMGVAYLMTKPCDIKSTAARISDISRRLLAPAPRRHDSGAAVSAMLLELQVPAKLNGYGYLRRAVLLKARDPGQSVTKELYPSVASACGGTAAQVERSIRGAITAAWENRDERTWRKYFAPAEGRLLSRPTNSAFISRLAAALLCTAARQDEDCILLRQSE